MKVTINIPALLHSNLRVQAQLEGTSLSRFISKILSDRISHTQPISEEDDEDE